MKQIFINMENEVFTGNILDAGFYNYGIVYNIYKQYNNNSHLEYITCKKFANEINVEDYDCCILFFSLSSIKLKFNKKRILMKMFNYLKDDGLVYIWDFDKSYGKIFQAQIKVMLPGRRIKEFVLRDYNVFEDSSKDGLIKILNEYNEYFEIVEIKYSDNIYRIKCKKKGRITNEGAACSH